MRVSINKDLCIGCGACEATCPEVFKLVEEVSTVLMNSIPDNLKDLVLDAEAGCPVEAIEVKE